MRDPITIADVLDGPMIADLPGKPVRILGRG